MPLTGANPCRAPSVAPLARPPATRATAHNAEATRRQSDITARMRHPRARILKAGGASEPICADYNVSVTDSHRQRGSVVFTAWVVTVLLVVIPPLWIALALTSSRERAMHRVRRWARRVFAWCGCSLRITGLQ